MEDPWKTLKSEKEYYEALERTIEIFHADKNTPDGSELDILLPLIIEYEDNHFHIPTPEPGAK
jgi:HTH-type transcriptional regulator/antitoxin HigA